MYKKKYGYKKNYQHSNQRKSYDEYTHEHSLCACSHDHSFFQELVCHLPIALVSFCITFLSVVFFDSICKGIGIVTHEFYHNLFHISHYSHTLFASAGSLITFLRFSKKSYLVGILVALFSSLLFCTLSDIIFPTLSGQIMGFEMHIHLCLVDIRDFINVILFAFAGIITAICIIKKQNKYNLGIIQFIHTSHIVTSCIAAFMYILSHTSINWTENAGILLIILVASVVFPCIISDIMAPFIGSKLYTSKNNVYTESNEI